MKDTLRLRKMVHYHSVVSGGNGRRSGTYDYYMSEPIVEDDAKGVGPFLLAYTELLRYENK